MDAFSGIEAGDWVRFSARANPETKFRFYIGKDTGAFGVSSLDLTKIERLQPPANPKP